eukprot:m.49406 g.49406  ORF g.49406 m.49406 type:complete len:193 (-) comp6479_c0_seq3:171-749(-)
MASEHDAVLDIPAHARLLCHSWPDWQRSRPNPLWLFVVSQYALGALQRYILLLLLCLSPFPFYTIAWCELTYIPRQTYCSPFSFFFQTGTFAALVVIGALELSWPDIDWVMSGINLLFSLGYGLCCTNMVLDVPVLTLCQVCKSHKDDNTYCELCEKQERVEVRLVGIAMSIGSGFGALCSFVLVQFYLSKR